MMDKYIDIVYISAGGGHKSAAYALKSALNLKHPEVVTSTSDTRNIIDSIDYIRKLTGIKAEEIYNLQVKNNWAIGTRYQLKVVQWFIRLFHDKLQESFKNYWSLLKPDVIVSVTPHLNKPMADAAKDLNIPFVTIMCDMIDHPPHFWMEPECDNQIIMCPTTYAIVKTHHRISSRRLRRIDGIMINPEFYNLHYPYDRGSDKYKGLVFFGGNGSYRMIDIAKYLCLHVRKNINMTFICGNNEKLVEDLKRLDVNYPKEVIGFSPYIPNLMQESDFLIGKPGPGVLTEAAVCKLPVITERRNVLFQEEFNLHWIEQNNTGVVLNDFSELPEMLSTFLEEWEPFVESLNNLLLNGVWDAAEFVANL